MNIFKPDIYKKNIFEIDYKNLKQKGIKCLVFDLDNTLGLIDETTCPKETKKLINRLKKDFLIFISSNNTNKRIKPYVDDLGIFGVGFSLKPSIKGLVTIRKKHKLNKSEMVMIGDQIVTDIFSGNRYGIKTILVDPLGKKDLKITNINRKIEKVIVDNYKKRGIFERGNYYG